MMKSTFDPAKMRERIREELKRQRRSQSEVVEAAGLGHGYLTNLLAREQMPSVDKLDALCAELGVSIAWVMYGTNVPPDLDRVIKVMSKDPKKFYALLDLLD